VGPLVLKVIEVIAVPNSPYCRTLPGFVGMKRSIHTSGPTYKIYAVYHCSEEPHVSCLYELNRIANHIDTYNLHGRRLPKLKPTLETTDTEDYRPHGQRAQPSPFLVRASRCMDSLADNPGVGASIPYQDNAEATVRTRVR
jgi:hypothetical protein